jgi:hypothetical protein
VARDEPIVRPARTDEWQVVAADKGVAEDWDRWAKQEPNALAAAYDPTDGGRRRPERKGRGSKLRRRVIIEAVHPGHPKQTERKRG